MADRFDACLAFTLREEGGYAQCSARDDWGRGIKNFCGLDAFCNNVCVVFPAARGNRAAVNIFGY